MSETTVVVGAGHAAGQAIASLRQLKYAGQIVLLGDEPYLPYQRPPLSKKFLAGEMPADRLYVKPESFYADNDVHVELDTLVDTIAAERRAVYSGERAFAYDHLILALGSRVREVNVPGAGLGGIHYLRTIADVHGIQTSLAAGQRLVIVGAGYIGLEVAAVARSLGAEVTVIEMAERVMSRVVSPAVSAFYEHEHEERGVRLLLNCGLESFVGDSRVTAVRTTAGDDLPADLVLVGIGIQPNVEIAAAAGLDVDNGIVVDARCRTSHSDIYAIGDCTAHPNGIYARQLRLESVHNALEQAKTAAAMIAGDAVDYNQVPWFWSDQYDLKLQIAGLSTGYDEAVIRGSTAERRFACLYLREGCLIAVDAVNAPRDFLQAKALIAQHARLDQERMSDADVPLKDLVLAP